MSRVLGPSRSALCIAALLTAPLRAAVGQPSSAECGNAATALSAGGAGATWYVLAECGASGADALATALRAARQRRDTTYLNDLYIVTSRMRAPALLQAALDVFADESALLPPRILSLLTLRSHSSNVMSEPVGTSWTTRSSLAGWQPCRVITSDHASYATSIPLASNALEIIAAYLDEILVRSSSPTTLKAAASCVRSAMLSAVPHLVLASDIGLAYVCGNKFRVSNQGHDPLEVDYEVVGTGERSTLYVAPSGSRVFMTVRAGTVRLIYKGQLIREQPNGLVAC